VSRAGARGLAATYEPGVESAALRIRDSADSDLRTIQAIYAHHVLHGSASFELEPPDLAEIARRRADVLANGFPYLVAEQDGQVLGYAYVNFFRTRPAYRFSVENSIYVDEQCRGRGVGRRLLEALIERAEAAGARQIIAVIGDSGNTASIGLHAACGFRFAGLLTASGWKFDRWVDTVLMQRRLGEGELSDPPPGR
jgi:phosphinothricin acetyltransferase